MGLCQSTGEGGAAHLVRAEPGGARSPAGSGGSPALAPWVSADKGTLEATAVEWRGSAANRWDKASSSCRHLQPFRGSRSIPWHCRGLGPHPRSLPGCSVPSPLPSDPGDTPTWGEHRGAGTDPGPWLAAMSRISSAVPRVPRALGRRGLTTDLVNQPR